MELTVTRRFVVSGIILSDDEVLSITSQSSFHTLYQGRVNSEVISVSADVHDDSFFRQLADLLVGHDIYGLIASLGSVHHQKGFADYIIKDLRMTCNGSGTDDGKDAELGLAQELSVT